MARNTSILLGDYFENFIKEKVASGKYSSVSEVVRTALRIFEEEEKTFDWGAEFSFNASNSGEGGWRFTGSSSSSILIRPENFRVKIIGAARRGSSWHGSKFKVGIN